MANPMITFTERLKSTIVPADHQSASKNIELISQYFDDRISENEAGNKAFFLLLYSLNFFCTHNGIFRSNSNYCSS